MTKKKIPRDLKNIMGDVFSKIGMTQAYDQYKTLQIWNTVVGETISKVTNIEKIQEGELFVKVKNPAWRMELNFRKKEIKKRLNNIIGYEMVRNIIFR